MNYVIGCNIGSQSLKVPLISADGKTCGKTSASYPIDYPQPAWAEQSAVDFAGLPVSITGTVETTALGAGILALAGSGLMGSLAEAVDLTTHVVETREHLAKARATYEPYYQLYRTTYFSPLPAFEQSANLKL